MYRHPTTRNSRENCAAEFAGVVLEAVAAAGVLGAREFGVLLVCGRSALCAAREALGYRPRAGLPVAVWLRGLGRQRRDALGDAAIAGWVRSGAVGGSAPCSLAMAETSGALTHLGVAASSRRPSFSVSLSLERERKKISVSLSLSLER